MGKLLDKLRRVQAGGRPFCTMIVPAAGSSAPGSVSSAVVVRPEIPAAAASAMLRASRGS